MLQLARILLAVACAAFLATTVWAQAGPPGGGQPGGFGPGGGPPPDPNQLFNQLDRNADGQLTANELPNLNTVPPPFRAALMAADKNGDGALSRDEFLGSFPGRPNGPPGGNGQPPTGGPPTGTTAGAGTGAPFGFGNSSGLKPEPAAPIKSSEIDKLFRQFDANHDGKLTADEAPSQHRDVIEKLITGAGKDADGGLSKVEFREALKRSPELGAQLVESDAKFMFQEMDVNRDGQLTADEIPQAHRALFDRLLAAGDKDGDGALSRREYTKASGPAAAKPPQAARTKPAGKKKPSADSSTPDGTNP